MTTYHVGETYLKMQFIDSGFYPRRRLNEKMNWVKEETHWGGKTYIFSTEQTQNGYVLKKAVEIKDRKRSNLEMVVIAGNASVSVPNSTEEMFYRNHGG